MTWRLVASSVRKITLEVGQLQETVVVTGATQLVQTESASVSTTLTTAQITKSPLSTRNTLDFVAALPGVNTTSTIRNSTVMGLTASSTNITIDGINVQDNYLKSSDGFFARINPRMDAVEEVTVSSATPGAESAGQGTVANQVRHSLGHQPVPGQRLRVLPPAELEHQLLVQRARRPAQ